MPTMTPIPACRVLRAPNRGAISSLPHLDTFAPPRFGISHAPDLSIRTSLRPPRRAIVPTPQRRRRPSRRLVGVTKIAGVWNLQRLGLLRPNETECVAADLHVAEGLGDCRHMTRGAGVPRAARGVMRVLLDGGGMRSVLRVRTVAGQADGVPRLAPHVLTVAAV